MIALNVLYDNQEKIYPAYVSKHNSKREKQVIRFIISNKERWQFHLVRKIHQNLYKKSFDLTKKRQIWQIHEDYITINVL